MTFTAGNLTFEASTPVKIDVEKNNTFKHIKKYCVCTYNYRGVVSGNKAVKCGNKRRIFKLGSNNNVIDRKNNW